MPRDLAADPGARGRPDSPEGGDRVAGLPEPTSPPAVALRRWAVPVLFVLLLTGFAAGIWGSYRAAFPGRGLYRLTGIFEARGGDTLILVRHEAVPGLMDEMRSMALVAESRELLDRADLRRGDRARFTVRTAGDRLVVVEIQKIR